LIALLVLAPLPLTADDWPTFGGKPDRNPVTAEKGFPSTWDAKKNVKWTAELGRHTYSNPVIAAGRVFIGTDYKPRDPASKEDKGVLMCFSAADGKFLWQALHEKLPGGPNVDAPDIGICSTPAATADFVYYVSNRDELVCRKAADGAQVWLLDMRKELGATQDQAATCSPLLVGDLLFVVTGHARESKEKPANPKPPSFIAVNAKTGKLVWQDSSPGARIISSQWGNAAYGVVDGQPQVVFPGGDGWLYAFEPPSGKLIWKFNCKAHEKADSSEAERNTLVATPVFAGPRVFIATGIDTDTSGPGCLRAIDARQKGDVTKTAELWKFAGEEFGVSISSVAVHDGLLYAAEYAGYINCIEVETGKRLWRHDLLTNIWGSPLVADGKVYVRTGEENVVVFQEGRTMKVLGKIELPGTSQGVVVPSDGVFYIAGNSRLWAVAESK
jgi:outer membrane protein assembly factor BamB